MKSIINRNNYKMIKNILTNNIKKPYGRHLFSSQSSRCIELETKYGAHNYHPIPCVISKGKGCEVWDVEGKKYFDFLSAYSAVNQGHCHPKIVKTLADQASKLTLTSRAFYNDTLGEYAEFVTKYFNYERMLPMNTGVEACESAVKIARRWAYEIKGVPQNEAIIIFAENNFWGRSIAAVSASTDPDSYNNYGPYVPNFVKIPFNNTKALIDIIEYHDAKKVAAFMVEPIQGEAGVIIPDNGYLKQIRKICDDNNILWIADEVQTGLGRCGAKLCVDHEKVRPDMLTLGKALSGGVYPVSAVLSSHTIMNVLTPGTHGSTYGGNPLANKVAMTALKVLDEENMVENSKNMGILLLKGLQEIQKDFDIITTVRGKGLFCAMEIIPDEKNHIDAWKACLNMMNRGLLAKPTHDTIIRLAPPLIINKQQIEQSLDIIRKGIQDTIKSK